MSKRQLKTMDGNTAAAHVAYAFSEVAAIYPITPSSPMAESIDEWTALDRKNIFGEQVKVMEMQSEGGAAGAVHGAVTAGAYTSTFTASQGLLLMIPNMYKIAAEQTPAVFHVAARALATHALSIFGDHQDVMATRQTGFAILASNSVQQVMDLGAVAHLATIASEMPTLHFFDGFRTSHEQQKIGVWDYDQLKGLVDWNAVKVYRAHSLNPEHPHLMGAAEQPEAYFQHREAINGKYDAFPDVVNEYMKKINKMLGTHYKPFNYYGDANATDIMVAMGSACDAAEEVVDYINKKNGRRVGIIEVHLYRPFSTKYLLKVMPKTVKNIAVLDRTKEPGSLGEPLFQDIVSAIKGTEFEDANVVGGRYGLGSKDVQPGDLLAVFENIAKEKPKKEFTIGIDDDVTHLSLKPTEYPETSPEGTKACKFWGLGADGTVGANKNSVKIIGDHTEMKVQAYFQYDSKKSGGVTISHLRFGDRPIKSTYYIKQADFVACHNSSYLKKYDMVQEVKPGGMFLLNCVWDDDELDEHLPAKVKRYIVENGIRLFTCDAVNMAKEIGLGARRTNTILQAAFFKIAEIIPMDEAEEYMKEAIRKTYGRKGEKIVNMNIAAVDAGMNMVHEVEVPEEWANCPDDPEPERLQGRDGMMTDYLNKVLVPMSTMKGDEIPVSVFMDTADGAIPSGTAAYEKRGVAADIPKWIKKNCIQCNRCSMVCSHGVIRPFVLNKTEAKRAGEDIADMIGKGLENKKYAIAISAMDCTGCGLCAEVCPAKEKALVMQPVEDELVQETQKKFDYMFSHVKEKKLPFSTDTVKGIQFKQPLLEFSGACPGCGETPYAKLVTQLFGDRMFIANATGCSSIWGNSAPSTPYTVNKDGRGPAWSNSLFEDNAEFGLGMAMAVSSRRKEVADCVELLKDKLGEPAEKWLKYKDNPEKADAYTKPLLDACARINGIKWDWYAEHIIINKDMLKKPSVWAFGGDGWAYDIGYGGVDHVLASRENINLLVFDTEVYSNTGGQASKATPVGAVAKFAAAGKSVRKKDLAQIAMAYGYVYVAKIAMGADYNQTIQAFKEAEAYDGPSIIIAYSPCINHGIKKGMNKIMVEEKNAVECGYWNLLRFNPELAEKGENPLILDSKAPKGAGYEDFLMGEVRYNSLKLKFPERAEKLFKQNKDNAMDRYQRLVHQKESYDQ